MTLISEIVTDAYRETNRIAVGRTETVAEQAEGVKLLNRYIRALLGNELGDPLDSYAFGENNIDANSKDYERTEEIVRWFVPQNRRLILNLTEAKEVNLFPFPEDGCRFAVADASDNLSTFNLTVKGNGNTIEGNTSIVLNTNGLDAQWFYREDLANWLRVSQLEADDELPFPAEFEDMFVIGLAMRLVGRQGTNLSDASIVIYNRLMTKFKARYKQTQPVPLEEALRRITGNRRLETSFSRQGSFERGTITW